MPFVFPPIAFRNRGRTAAGVKAMALETGDEVLFADLIGTGTGTGIVYRAGLCKTFAHRRDRTTKEKRQGAKDLCIAKGWRKRQ